MEKVEDEQKLGKDMPEISTGNGYANDLAATTNDRLKKTVIELRQLNEWSQAQILHQKRSIEVEVDTTKALKALITTVEKLDEKNGKLQEKIFFLTIATVVLTIFTVALTAVQVFVLFNPHSASSVQTQRPAPTSSHAVPRR